MSWVLGKALDSHHPKAGYLNLTNSNESNNESNTVIPLPFWQKLNIIFFGVKLLKFYLLFVPKF